MSCQPRALAGNLDGGEPSTLDLDVHLIADGAVHPGAFEEVRRHAGSPASRRSVAASASTPARQSSMDAYSAGEWETPVGLRTKSIAVGMPAAERMPASWPAAVGMMGQSLPPWCAARRAARSGSNLTAPDTDSAVTTSEVPSREARSEACRSTVPTRSASASSEDARASSQAGAAGGTQLVEVGATSTRPNVAR